MVPGVLLLLPLVTAAAAPLNAGLAPPGRAPTGYSWTVSTANGGTLVVEAPVAVVEAVIPLPIRLHTTNTPSPVVVKVCESNECVLPTTVTVLPGKVVAVDALFNGRGPRLVVDDSGGCCDRALASGRALAFAGPSPRTFAFPSSGAFNPQYGAVPVDVGTFFLERPDLIDGFGAVILDDGWTPASLAEPLRRFVAAGGALSLQAHDASVLGLIDDTTSSTLLTLDDLPTDPSAYTPVGRDGDSVVIRLEDRGVRLHAPLDRVAHVGAGVIVLRAAGRAEDERIAQIVLADRDLLASTPQIEPRNAVVVGVAGAGLSPSTHGFAGFAIAMLAVGGIGIVLWRMQKRGPLVAAGASVVVALIGAGVLVLLRLAITSDASVTLSHWGPGDGSRRIVNAFARAPDSFGDVDLHGAPWSTPPTVVSVIGDRSWRSEVVRSDNGRVHAELSSSSGLVGLWFGTDATSGSLRMHSESSFSNTLPFALDHVLLPSNTGQLLLVDHVAAGASFSTSDGRYVDHFGSPVEERFARDVMNSCSTSQCIVGLATHDGVLTAIEGSR